MPKKFFANPAIAAMFQRVGRVAGGRDFVMAGRRGVSCRPAAGKDDE